MNIIARFRPDLMPRLLFGAHWDTRPTADRDPDPARRSFPIPGANDGASGAAVLVSLADRLRKEPPAVGVDLVWFDGEDYGDFADGADVLLGSKYMAKHLVAAKTPALAVILGLVGDRDLEILQEAISLRRAPRAVAYVWEQATRLGYASAFPRRRGPATADDHVALLDAGIPSVVLSDVFYADRESGEDYHHTMRDDLEHISGESLSVMTTLMERVARNPPAWLGSAEDRAAAHGS